jgi:hypothetical protein
MHFSQSIRVRKLSVSAQGFEFPHPYLMNFAAREEIYVHGFIEIDFLSRNMLQHMNTTEKNNKTSYMTFNISILDDNIFRSYRRKRTFFRGEIHSAKLKALCKTLLINNVRPSDAQDVPEMSQIIRNHLFYFKQKPFILTCNQFFLLSAIKTT